ncbi:MAG TPA: outer membrane lipid asymmetry maintenance protein MlaD [Alphaproteobacteria bacterium]|nr:outer membrane lipid asymmetry maintenance protein MlaD [Alphaproteobacteria bacterium]
MSGNLVETLIGAVVLLVAGVFLAFAYTHTDAGAVSGYPLVAKFDRVDGLTVGADVKMSGIKIGTVTSQTLDPKTYQAVVHMNIAAQYKIPDDSTARVATESLLGGNYLELQPGGSPDMLAAGDQIEYTQGSVDLMGLIGQAIFSSGGSKGKKQQPATP